MHTQDHSQMTPATLPDRLASVSRQSRAKRRFTRSHKLALETLEPRTLLSAAVADATTQYLAAVPNESAITTPKYSNLWHLHNTGQTISGTAGTVDADIDAQEAWNLTTGSSNVVIAVFDTGIDLDHPDLVDNLWTNPGEVANNGKDDDNNGFIDDFYGWNFVNGNNNVDDSVGHGTSVAGVIGAKGNNGKGISGVAWNVDILTVKIGTATGVTSQNLVNGINYVIALKKAGVNIVAINASYISTGTLGLSELTAIGNAGKSDILYVAAAGNGGINYDSFGFGAFLPSNMLLVGATDNRDNLASFSNYGQNSVAIAAPGNNILTTFTGGTYLTLSGTSYAGPMVSGVVALLKSYSPTATMAQIKNALLTGADTVSSLSGKIGGARRLNALKALQTLQGVQPPIGYVDVISSSAISGWAFDASAGVNPINVQIVIDGVSYAPVAANVDRPDLTAVVGSPAHGFVISTPALASGNHTVSVYALDDPSSAGTLIGSATINVNKAPIGFVDQANMSVVSGWAIDQDVPSQSINVRVDIDGVLYTTTAANTSRPDVNSAFSVTGAHGYTINLPGLSPGLHRIDVYALDSVTGAGVLLGSRTVDGNHAPLGYLDGAAIGRIAGWAWDVDTSSQSVRVRLDIDNFAPVYILANVSRPDIDSYTGGPHAFEFALPQLTAGTHSIKAYAIDTTSGFASLIGSRSLTVTSPAGNTLPRGYFDGASTSLAYGWVFDPSTSDPINVRIDIDGTTAATFLANQNRPDLSSLGSTNHGFSYSLPALSTGAHTIDVYALDSATSTSVWINRRIVTTAALAGSVDSLTTSAAIGWAFNPSLSGVNTRVRLDVNDFIGTAYSASITRNDITPVVGSPDHGFSFNLPKVAAGQHRIRIWLLDDFQAAKLLTDQTLTFA